MKYKATAKFQKLTKANHHQGLDKDVYEALMEGEVVTLEIPPSRLIDGGYIKEFKEKESE